jgi:hypothetical protein
MPVSSPTSAVDVALEVERLKEQLRAAEQASNASHKTSADVSADQIRQRLADKERELVAAQAAESQAADEQQHAQALLALEEIENDCRTTKAQLDSLRAEQGTFAKRIFDAEFRHSQMLRVRAEARKQLGL